ncbi:uncharacterized protein (TIGR00297 family) [Granulicella aggregans]|uniref:Uncharacterized protein (TIGR00297 family) n=1 Tax=Granulicella aggregans TaxID=474949 RepID=A0A7W7Z8Z3_9BACT|nr:DUF92 domain-containing protein [Granulicella aggregans]MBB5055524.1 uncharacterized protein (TIGR00297 family) [Granulicella aggregans]
MTDRPIVGTEPVVPPGGLKLVPASRDRKQSDLLTGAVGILLILKLAVESWRLHAAGPFHKSFYAACVFSVVFALFVWLIRSATAPAAAMGGVICMNLLLRQADGFDAQNSAIFSLIALFILTFAATRFGRSRKESLGVAELRSGRRASQVIANLGAAGLLAATGRHGTPISTFGLAACVAALAEATADTVSSEVGQALASTRLGATILITSGRPVPPGTDGGVSVAGTLAGMLGAMLVIMASPFAYTYGPALCIFAGAVGGLIFDSILGATVERKGWLNNDLVNFASTVFAAIVAWTAHVLLYPILSTRL